MKSLISLTLFLSFVLTGFAAGGNDSSGNELDDRQFEGGSIHWIKAPNAATGYYYAYDNTEQGPPFDDPIIVGLPSFTDITDTGTQITPCDDDPYAYTLPDSFWFYGTWYEPGDTLYISPEGWISFDPDAEDGFADPPIDYPPFPVDDGPNTVISAIWQNNDPLDTPDPSDGVYYTYDATNKVLIIEWYMMKYASSSNTYTFEVMLNFGGENLLTTDECGVIFSGHFIEFLYNSCSSTWGADNDHDPPAVGIEDAAGDYGIYYQGSLANNRVIRFGYLNPSGYENFSMVEDQDEVLTDLYNLEISGNQVQYVLPADKTGKLEVLDVVGRSTYSKTVGTKGKIEFTALPAGLYFVRLTHEQGAITSKMILVR